MEQKNCVLELPNGMEVELENTWVIDDETKDSYSVVDILDHETGEVIGSYNGELPDFEDEDFDIDKLVEDVQNALRD